MLNRMIISLILILNILYAQNSENNKIKKNNEEQYKGQIDKKIKPKINIIKTIRILLDTIAIKDINRFSEDIQIYPKYVEFRGEKKNFSFNLVDFDIDEDHPLTVQKNLYLGKILFHRREKDFVDVINEVDIEMYVKGVVAAEVPGSWEAHALMAQGIIARTYAYFRLKKSVSSYYDLTSTVKHQVYFGKNKINERIEKAVDKTRRIVITYKNKIIEPFFSANSGGYTEIPENVWGGTGDYGYLEHIESPFDESGKGYSWSINYKIDEIQKKLKLVKKIKSVDIVDYTTGRRVNNIEITFLDGGTLNFKGNVFREKMGYGDIKSLLFNMERVGNIYFIKGNGFGHGVGFSQEGANEQAKQGRSVKNILDYYYKNIKLMRVKK